MEMLKQVTIYKNKTTKSLFKEEMAQFSINAFSDCSLFHYMFLQFQCLAPQYQNISLYPNLPNLDYFLSLTKLHFLPFCS